MLDAQQNFSHAGIHTPKFFGFPTQNLVYVLSMPKCETCKCEMVLESEGDRPFCISSFCNFEKPEVLAAFLAAKTGEYVAYPCPGCGCAMEGELPEDREGRLCSSCHRLDLLKQSRTLLAEASLALENPKSIRHETKAKIVARIERLLSVLNQLFLHTPTSEQTGTAIMCMTLHASEMEGTRLYAGEAMMDGKYVHVLGYQNKAVSRFRGVNAMVLPIPAKVSLGPQNVLDTRGYKHILDDIAESTKRMSRSLSKGFDGDIRTLGVSSFKVGSYDVTVGTSMALAIDAVQKMSRATRPDLNMEVLNGIEALYPDWSYAICSWSGSVDAEPMLWWYEPVAPQFLFAPAVDAHEGQPPSGGMVDVDHFVTFGSTLNALGTQPVRYKDALPTDARQLLPTHAVGTRIKKPMTNGDFWFQTRTFKDAGTNPTTGELDVSAFRMFPGMTTARVPVGLGNWS